MTLKNHVLGYARVSTPTQDLEVQKDLITKYCHTHGYNLIDIIEDKMSGKSKSRPGWNIIMKNVHEKTIDGVVFLRVDRIARSTKNLLSIVDEFTATHIKLISIDDPIFQNDLESPQGKLMITVMGAMVEFESNITATRIQEGKERARRVGTKSGKPMHRPKINIDWTRYDELFTLGVPKSKIAVHLKISESKLYSALKEREITNGNTPKTI